MTARWGATALVAALVLTISVPRILSPGLVGQPFAAALPEPPQVGDCLSQTMQVVGCDQPHRWEVTARWSARDPDRVIEATSETCEERSLIYGNLATATVSGNWSYTTALISAVLQAPVSQRAGAIGWSVCTIQPAWVDERSGSLRTVSVPTDAPELFGICLDYASGNGGVDCGQIHDIQLLASTRGEFATPTSDMEWEDARTAATQPCRGIAEALMSAADPTYGGRLQLRTDIGPDTDSGRPAGSYEIRCFVVVAGGRLLNGSLTGLGDRPLPLV